MAQRSITDVPDSLPYRGLTRAQRFWLHVDKTPSCWLWTGCIHRTGYGSLRWGDHTFTAHRVAWELSHGALRPGMQLDHRCHNRACVNPAHLRLVSTKQNGENRRGSASGSRAGIRGVSWHKRVRKWEVTVTHNGTRIHGGYFADPVAAGNRAREMRLQLFTHNDLDRAVQS